MRTLPCGCTTDGRFICDTHRPRQASNGAALVAIALFIGMIAVWIRIFENIQIHY